MPTDELTPSGLTVGSPVLEVSPAFDIALAWIVSSSVGSPVIGAPTLQQIHDLTAVGITVNPPMFGDVSTAQAEPLTVGSPIFGAPQMAQHQYIKSASLTVGSPTLGAATFFQRYREYYGSQILYRAATGLERSMSDADALRLFDINAELIIDVWDPYKIPYHLLPYLAYAMGVNLWEDWWTEDIQRDWVARQWPLKSIRGTRAGLEEFTKAIGGQVKRVISPPAITYPLPSYTEEQRQAYVARFAQLRLYPYVPRELLPWLCYLGKHYNKHGERTWLNNGSFLGPLKPLYPTNQDQGGRYTRTAKLWDRGVETTLTFRTVQMEDAGEAPVEDVRTYDEAMLPGHIGDKYFIGMDAKWPRPKNTFTGKTGYGIFLGRLDPTEQRLIRIPRDGRLELVMGKAKYLTVSPSVELIDIYPEHTYVSHPRRKTELYARRGDFLLGKFLPPSNAWQYVYEKWYIFDADRVPDHRIGGVYLGRTRLGIAPYTAEAKVQMFTHAPQFYIRLGGYLRGYLRPEDTEPITRLRRGVVASKSLRDTILLDTMMMRPLQVRDQVLADGRYYVGQLVAD